MLSDPGDVQKSLHSTVEPPRSPRTKLLGRVVPDDNVQTVRLSRKQQLQSVTRVNSFGVIGGGGLYFEAVTGS